MNAAGRRARGGYPGFLAALAGIGALLVAAGWMPTHRLAGESGIVAMLAANLLTLAASAISGLPLAVARRAGGGAGASGFLKALGIRFAVVVVGAAAAVAKGLVEAPAFLVWVAISYLAYLVADVRYALSLARA